MTLPRRIPTGPKRSSRWRSLAHCAWIRGFACCVCGSATNIEAAHVRLGSKCGMGQKPDDWRTVPLCSGAHSNKDGLLGCHNSQHICGEQTFWTSVAIDPEALIAEFIKASPRRRQIEEIMRERAQ